ncbi:hypothetical protein Tco_0072914 [Tanacetum coccineum]
MKTPMSSDTKLTKDEDCESVDSTKYRGMIGTTHLGLWYPKGQGIEIVVYADYVQAEIIVDRRALSGLEVGSIRRIQGLDTTYWGFLRVGTTLDIFQNIIFISYFQYDILVFWIQRIKLYSSVVFGECRHGYAVSSLMDMAYWSSE